MASILLSLVAAFLLIVPAISQTPTPPASWKLALHWPNSFCRNAGVRCTPSIPQNAFVIRTLFGVSQFGQEITCSGSQPPLDRSVMDQIGQTLSLYWPDLQGDNFGLWQKEWQDRAACYGIDAFKYFTSAVGLKVAIDRLIVKGFGRSSFVGEQVFGALSRQGVQPGNTYPAPTFADKVSSKYGEALEVLCNDDAEEVNQLLEFHMCAIGAYQELILTPCDVQKTTECMKDTRFT